MNRAGESISRSTPLFLASVTMSLILAAATVEAESTVVDNADAATSRTGRWKLREREDAYEGSVMYSRGDAEFSFAPVLASGDYRVKIWWPRGERLSRSVSVTVFTAEGPVSFELDQSRGGGSWHLLGDFRFDGPSEIRIGASGRRVAAADAVLFEPIGGSGETTPPPPGDEIPDDPPSPPAGLAATVGDGFVTLDWSDNPEEDLAGYAVYRSTGADSFDLLADGLNASAFTDREVSAGQAYDYFVTAIDRAGNTSEPSSVVTAELPPPPDRSVHLAWDAPLVNEDGSELTDLQGFYVHVGDSTGVFLRKIDVGNVLEYRLESLDPGTYHFSVTAYDVTGNESTHPAGVSAEIQ